MLHIKLDSTLSFKNQVTKKLHAVARVVSHMDVDKQKCLMKAFIMPQFDYCPLVLMFHSRKLNNRINKINESDLRLTYKNNHPNFRKFFGKDRSITIFCRNLYSLAIKINKVKNDIISKVMKKI